MTKKTAKVVLLFIICLVAQKAVTAQNRNFSRPTILTASHSEEPLWHEKIYEDDDYLFVYHDYGKAEYTPNFFVYGRKQRKWIEIKKLSTEHAKLGLSPSSTAKTALQVSWD